MGPIVSIYEGIQSAIKGLLATLLSGVEVSGRVDNYLEFLAKFGDRLVDGTFITLEQALLAIVVAVIMATIFGVGRVSSSLLIRSISTTYIEFFRGTSLIVQLFWIFYVLPFFGVVLDPYPAGFIAVGLNLGAYGAEVVRGAIQAVPRGQYEAAYALNMSARLRMRRIVFPQAVVIMLPAWGNLLIELLKGTALVGLISVTDLMFQSRQIYSLSYAAIETFGTILIIYYLIARLLITPSMRALETRLLAILSEVRARYVHFYHGLFFPSWRALRLEWGACAMCRIPQTLWHCYTDLGFAAACKDPALSTTLFGALGNTLIAVFLGYGIAMVAGLVLAMGQRTKSKVLTRIVREFVEFIRSTPLVVQIFFVFFVGPQFGVTLSLGWPA